MVRSTLALMKTMLVSEFKAKCIAVLKEVQRSREPLVITLRGKPLVTVRPVEPTGPGKRLGGLKGDQEQGVKELALVADHGRFLMPFARILLAFDDLRHHNTAAARKKLQWLREHYPNNPLFLQEIAKLDHPSGGQGQY